MGKFLVRYSITGMGSYSAGPYDTHLEAAMNQNDIAGYAGIEAVTIEEVEEAALPDLLSTDDLFPDSE